MEAEGPPLSHQLPPPTACSHSLGSLRWRLSPSCAEVGFPLGVLGTRSVAWTGTCGNLTVAPRRDPPSSGGVPPQACTTQGLAAGAAPGRRPPASYSGPWSGQGQAECSGRSLRTRQGFIFTMGAGTAAGRGTRSGRHRKEWSTGCELEISGISHPARPEYSCHRWSRVDWFLLQVKLSFY